MSAGDLCSFSAAEMESAHPEYAAMKARRALSAFLT
jgi:hypothetical protein